MLQISETSKAITETSYEFLIFNALYVWLDDNEMRLEDNPHAKPLLKFSPKFIEFMKWDTEEQLDQDPIYHGWKSIYNSKQRTVSFSDMVRFVVLQRYGGIYVDAYQWSFKEDYNTAVLRLRANSTTTRMVIEGTIQNHMKFHPFDIKKYFWNHKQPKSILTPNINVWYDVFRPDLAPNEFINVEPMDATPALRKVDGFFPGAFTYHWHNNWKTKILPNSWMGVLQSAYDEFLNGQQSNIYNEYLEF
ncbi:15913_t:CDS:2 [Funneliformis mosseae]|uniref:15913_t:CDS:1 n=1 Tax=Funneliformis mosseae TaxID=27381 RepID=A0A9N8VQJ7_FUNMO|nr:15913_t:CDS:2 [Funneliformis mosseae]